MRLAWRKIASLMVLDYGGSVGRILYIFNLSLCTILICLLLIINFILLFPRVFKILWDPLCCSSNLPLNNFYAELFQLIISAFLHILLYFQLYTWPEIVMTDSFVNLCYAFMTPYRADSRLFYSSDVIGCFEYGYAIVAYDYFDGGVIKGFSRVSL